MDQVELVSSGSANDNSRLARLMLFLLCKLSKSGAWRERESKGLGKVGKVQLGGGLEGGEEMERDEEDEEECLRDSVEDFFWPCSSTGPTALVSENLRFFLIICITCSKCRLCSSSFCFAVASSVYSPLNR
eukprot:Lithocolla_globosa_v1_NODE_2913_length_1826_cov_4.334274.p3 type:complete len:131 gc:universal NODE_2913_length_1826_cov_4.334274:948-556(-)